jgi:hypothetical protein
MPLIDNRVSNWVEAAIVMLMKNQKGAVALWILVVLVIVLVAGALYWYSMQNSTQPATSATTQLSPQQTGSTGTQPTINDRARQNIKSQPSTTPSATIDQSSLTASPGEISLSGGSDTSQLFVTITSNAELVDALGRDKGTLAFSSGGYNPIPVTNGRWSVKAGNLTQPGAYVVDVYTFNGHILLTTGILTISSTKPSATIDQSSLTSSTTPELTGSVSGTSQIIVAVWPGNLSASQMTPSANNMPFWSSNTEIRDPEVQVTNGRWYTSIGNSEVAGLGAPVPYFPNGIYTVSVSDGSTGQILASAKLEITGPSIEVTNATASTITFSYADLPGNSQILLAGQSNDLPIIATVSGSGSDSISISGGLQGTYWLQVELNGNANNVLQSGPFSANEVGH